MKTSFIFLSTLLITISTSFSNKYELVWQDEFDKKGSVDAKKWGFEVGFIRNFEEQYYTNNTLKNTRVEDGKLIIQAHKEKVKNASFISGHRSWQKSRKTAKYSSSSINTFGKSAWKYGKIEVRAKLPKGKGMWPAIWMMGTDRPKVGWPKCGEIDIMEQLGRIPNKIHGTIHWDSSAKNENNPKHSPKHSSNSGHTKLKSPPSEAFHLYSIEWTKDKIEFYFDNKSYHKIDLTAMPASHAEQFRKPHYLLINLALGGTWGKKIDPKVFPQKFEIDYVRVYQKKVTSN